MTKIHYNHTLLYEYCKNNYLNLSKNYENINLTRDTEICGFCINKDCNELFKKKFVNLVKYGAFCKNCANLNKIINMKKTNLKKYGVENPFQSEEIKEKIKKTNINKYGVENPAYSEEIREKTKKKCLEKYGVENSFKLIHVIEERKKSMLNKYGSEYPFQSKQYQEIFKNKCLEKYSVENPHQVPEIAEKASKNSYRRKIYILPSGKELTCQGYEPLALDKLIKEENISEEDIVTGCKNVPEIWYNDEDGKKHRHYVDIYIPSQNRCIEVKSTWTAEKKKDNIYLKQNAAKELGFQYEIWVYNSKKQLIEIK